MKLKALEKALGYHRLPEAAGDVGTREGEE